MHIAQQLNLGTQVVNTLSVSSGVVWIGVQGASYGDAGMLLRIDAASGRQTGSWTVGGEPVAIAAAGSYVWVANGFGDGSRILPEQNTVMQLNASTGAVVHIYPVTDPRGVVANGDSAVVVSSRTANGPTEMRVLTAGRSSTIAIAPGNLQAPWVSSESALAVCSNQLYLAISDVSDSGTTSVTLYATPPTGGTLRTVATLLNYFNVSLTCDSASLFVDEPGGDNGGIVRVNLADGSVSARWGGLYPWGVAFASGRVWAVYAVQGPSTQPFVTSVNPITGVESLTHLTIPSTAGYIPFLLVPDASGLWVVGGNGNLVLHITDG